MTTQSKLAENVDKAIHAEDRPMEEAAPSAPFAFVGLSYILILAFAMAIIALLIYAF